MNGRGSDHSIFSVSTGSGIHYPHLSVSPPIHPRTSSLSATQLRPITEGYVVTTELAPPSVHTYRPGIYRNLSSSSEPSIGSPILTSTCSTPYYYSPGYRISSGEDFAPSERLYNPRHSAEGSLLSLGLSRAEKRTISIGIEKDEARAEERAEERRKSTNSRKFAGMMRSGSDILEAETLGDSGSSSGWPRGRKWEHMFSQNNSDEGRWPLRDEPLDPVEVQALGMLVPLMGSNSSEIIRSGDTLIVARSQADEGILAEEELDTSGTVKRRKSTLRSDALFERPSIIFRVAGAKVKRQEENVVPELSESVGPLPPSDYIKNQKSLGHKLSATLLRYIGHSRSLTSSDAGTPSEIKTSSPYDMTASTSVTSLPDGNPESAWRSKRWRSRRRNKPPRLNAPTEKCGIRHPLQEHYEYACQGKTARCQGKYVSIKKQSQSHAMVNALIGVIKKQRGLRSKLKPLEGSSEIADRMGVEGGRWNGRSWESEKFREAGRYVIPAIGEGSLVLDRELTHHLAWILLTVIYQETFPVPLKLLEGLKSHMPP